MLEYHAAFAKAQYDPDPRTRSDLFTFRGYRHQPSLDRTLLKFEFEWRVRSIEAQHGGSTTSTKSKSGGSKAKTGTTGGDCSVHPGKGHSNADCKVQRSRASKESAKSASA